MTILMKDAKADLASRGITLHEECLVHEIVYADDTLLLDADADAVAEFMDCVAAAGRRYGLSLQLVQD